MNARVNHSVLLPSLPPHETPKAAISPGDVLERLLRQLDIATGLLGCPAAERSSRVWELEAQGVMLKLEQLEPKLAEMARLAQAHPEAAPQES